MKSREGRDSERRGQVLKAEKGELKRGERIYCWELKDYEHKRNKLRAEK